jgi:hypothetical protein
VAATGKGGATGSVRANACANAVMVSSSDMRTLQIARKHRLETLAASRELPQNRRVQCFAHSLR